MAFMINALILLLALPNVIAGAYGLYAAAAAVGTVALWVGTSGAGWVLGWLADAALLSGPLGGLGRRVAQQLGSGLLLLSVVLFTLFDAACRGRQSASTFRTVGGDEGAHSCTYGTPSAALPCYPASAALCLIASFPFPFASVCLSQLNIGVLVVSLCTTSIAAAQPSLFCCPALARCVVGCAGALAALAAWQYFLAKKK